MQEKDSCKDILFEEEEEDEEKDDEEKDDEEDDEEDDELADEVEEKGEELTLILLSRLSTLMFLLLLFPSGVCRIFLGIRNGLSFFLLFTELSPMTNCYNLSGKKSEPIFLIQIRQKAEIGYPLHDEH